MSRISIAQMDALIEEQFPFAREFGFVLESLGDGVVVVDRNIDVHIRAVRKKIGEYAGHIETVRGVGYRFAD